MLLLAAWLPLPAAAAERILAYDSEVEIRADGSLVVTERIRVRAEGEQVRRGIYRDFPTRYRDRYGNRVRVDFEVLSVARNGEAEPWFTERLPNGVRLNTGSDELLPVPAEHDFTLRFRTTRQLGFFPEHDELYWNAIGTGWSLPIEGGTVEVRLPRDVPVEDMSAEAYTGPQGAQGQDYAAELTGPGAARFRLTAPLGPGEGFTIVLTFPKGIVAEPSPAERARWFFSDNVGVLVAFAGLAVLAFYCLRRWQNRGRDPRPGTIIPRYFVPAGHGPAGLRYLLQMSYDARCFSSDILALAVAGRLRIRREEKFLRKDRWALERLDDQAAGSADGKAIDLPEPQRRLLAGIFASGQQTMELQTANATTLAAARAAHQGSLDRSYHGAFFRRNVGSTVIAALLGAASIALAFAVSGGNGHVAIVLIALLMLVIVTAFGYLVRAPTAQGRRLMDEIEGLRLYLGVAEREELARMGGPDDAPTLDAARYEALLPYAVALEVENAWTEKFTRAVGAAAAAEAVRRIGWYRGNKRLGSSSALSRALGSSLGSQVAAASSPPGSRSGAGGGGSSGGGGGGGGGGGR
jgi:uncharacterized membrane protein YgcG